MNIEGIYASLARRTIGERLKGVIRDFKIASLCEDALTQRAELEKLVIEGKVKDIDPQKYDALSAQEFGDIVSGLEDADIRDYRIEHNLSLLLKIAD